MKNFGFSELYIVSPQCDPLGFDAIKYSKHARELLENAKICKTFNEARKGCKFTVGTTGVLYRHWADSFRNPIKLSALKERLSLEKEGKIAIAFGGEGVGLSLEQINECDFLTTIPTSGKYPILNLSHAVAIVLYELSEIKIWLQNDAGESEKEHLQGAFGFLVDRIASEMRNPEKVKIAFKRMVGKSMINDKECVSILGVLRRINTLLDSKKTAARTKNKVDRRKK